MNGAQIVALFMLGLIALTVIFFAGFAAGRWWGGSARNLTSDEIRRIEAITDPRRKS